MSDDRFVPTPDGPHLDFYRHATTGTLHLQRCSGCGRFQHPPRYGCPACAGADLEWVPSAGTGEIYSWTVTHRPIDPGWADRLPYATVVVELDEGVRLVGALEGLAPDELTLGSRMQMRVEPAGDDFAFLWFSPDEARSGPGGLRTRPG